MRLLTSVTLAICLFVFCNQSSSNNEDTSEMTLSTYTSIQAQQGIFGRGVLVDIARSKCVLWLTGGTVIYASDLKVWEMQAGIKVGSGDILLLRTGSWKQRVSTDASAAGSPLSPIATF